MLCYFQSVLPSRLWVVPNQSNDGDDLLALGIALPQVFKRSDESTIWSSPYGEVTGQWILFDLRGKYPVGAFRLLAMKNTTCPKQVRLATRMRSSRFFCSQAPSPESCGSVVATSRIELRF